MRKTLFSEVRTAPNCDWEIVVKVVGMMPREGRAESDLTVLLVSDFFQGWT